MAKYKHQAQHICLSEEVEEGGLAVCYQVRRDGELRSAFLIRYCQQVYSYLNSCAHLSIEMDWTPGRFFDLDCRYLICSTHGALFEPESGFCVEGPCIGRNLTPIRVQEIDNVVLLQPGVELVTI